MEVARSGYYKSLKATIKKEEVKIVVAMKAIAKKFRYSYGKRRLSKALQKEGFGIGVYATKTLMHKYGIESKQRKVRKNYNYIKRQEVEGKNILNRRFDVEEPNLVWCGDITQITTGQGEIYLAGIIDLYSRKIIGQAMDKQMTEELIIRALQVAINQRQIKDKKLLHHSDRGSQYTAKNYKQLMEKQGFTISLSDKGKCLDNAVTERFWGSLKSEWTNGKIYKTIAIAEMDINFYIHNIYNSSRLHSALGYATPNEFEELFYKKQIAPKTVSTFT